MQEETNNEMDDGITNEPIGQEDSEITNEPIVNTGGEISAESTAEASSQYPPTIKPMPRSKKQKILITAALVLIGFLLLQLGQIIAANMNPKAYLNKVLFNTVKGYESELTAMKKNNPVLNRYGEILAGPSQHRLAMDSAFITDSMGVGAPSFNLDFMMTNDPEKKQFQFGTDFPLIGGAYFYLSDQEAIISFLSESYTLDAKKAGEEVRLFLDNNEIPYDESVMPKDLDISYSALSRPFTVNDANAVSPSIAKVSARYSEEFKKLYDAVKLTRTKGTVQLGTEEVKCTVMVLTCAENDFGQWLSGFYDKAKDDAELKELLAENYESAMTALEESIDYDGGDITVEFFIYKDSVVETFISLEDGTRIGFATRGKDCRLDHIEISSVENGEETKFTIKGNHIGQGIFTSEISDGEETIMITWDPAGSVDNASIQTPDGENTVFTLALDEDGVIMKPLSGDDSDRLIIKAFPVPPGSINWPIRTTPLTGLNLQELFAGMNLFG